MRGLGRATIISGGDAGRSQHLPRLYFFLMEGYHHRVMIGFMDRRAVVRHLDWIIGIDMQNIDGCD